MYLYIAALLTIIFIVLLIGSFLYKNNYFGLNRNGGMNRHSAGTDPEAQNQYIEDKHKQEPNKISVSEALELSWQFLYKITDIIMNKFSAKDREEVNKIGEFLFKRGVKYEHIVEFGLDRNNPSKAAKIEQEQKVDGPGSLQ